MTEIKIPFTKTKVEKVSDPQKPANAEGLSLEITTDFYMSSLGVDLTRLHGGNPDNTLVRMQFVFWDNIEATMFQDLLDSSKTNFELNFDKEKVNFYVGGANTRIDRTKPDVILFQHPDDRMLKIIIGKQHGGVIKLTPTQIPPNISQIRNNAITAIKQALNSEPKLATSNLSSEYQNWETTINNSSNESQINSFKDKVLNDIKSKRTEREREREQKWQLLDYLLSNRRNSIISDRDNYSLALNKFKNL